jgi:ABC-type spermidine/putrescine transport system permease subunit II
LPGPDDRAVWNSLGDLRKTTDSDRLVASCIWLALPIAVVILFSFNNPHGRYNCTWTGFTLKWWGPALFKFPELTRGWWLGPVPAPTRLT